MCMTWNETGVRVCLRVIWKKKWMQKFGNNRRFWFLNCTNIFKMYLDLWPTKLMRSTFITRNFAPDVCQICWRTTTNRKAWQLQWPNLNVITEKAKSFLATGVETWIVKITTESKKHTGFSKPSNFKHMLSAQKIMPTVLRDRKGLIHVEFLPQKTTTSAESYSETLRKLRRAIQGPRCDLLNK
jgi:hypothetical protein